MDSQPEKSRNRPLLLAAAIALLVLLSLLMIREKFIARPPAHHSETVSIAVAENDDCVCPCPTNRDIAQPPSVAIPQPEPKSAEFNLIDSANADPPTSGAFLIDPGSAPFAGIDMRRILSARQLDTLSPETKSNLLARIKRLTAKRAESHRLEFVFDTSDQTLNGTPAFINPTNGLLDLTDEVLKELPQ